MRRIFVWVLAIGLLQATVLLLNCRDLEIIGGDGPHYQALAQSLMRTGGFYLDEEARFPCMDRCPGYPLFLAAAMLPFGQSLFVVRCLQCLILLAAPFILWHITRPLLDERLADISALLCVLYTPIMLAAMYHLTEAISVVLLLAYIYFLAASERTGNPRMGALCGLSLGIAAEFRPGYFPLIAATVALLIYRSRLRSAMFAAALCLLVITPWTLRNLSIVGRVFPFCTGSGYSLYLSSQQYAGTLNCWIDHHAWDGLFEENRQRRQRIGYKKGHDPLGQLLMDEDYWRDGAQRMQTVSGGRKLAHLLTREAYLWGVAVPMNLPFNRLYRWSCTQSVAGGLLVLVGLRTALANKKLWPLLVVPLYIALLHGFFCVEARYSIPARAFFIPIAALGYEQMRKWIIRS